MQTYITFFFWFLSRCVHRPPDDSPPQTVSDSIAALDPKRGQSQALPHPMVLVRDDSHRLNKRTRRGAHSRSRCYTYADVGRARAILMTHNNNEGG